GGRHAGERDPRRRRPAARARPSPRHARALRRAGLSRLRLVLHQGRLPEHRHRRARRLADPGAARPAPRAAPGRRPAARRPAAHRVSRPRVSGAPRPATAARLYAPPAPPPSRPRGRLRDGVAMRTWKMKRHDQKAISFHYDVSNDFYALFLDTRMVYTCAYYRDPNGDLDQAQADKLDLVCRKLRLTPGDRLLDIGCGWGS